LGDMPRLGGAGADAETSVGEAGVVGVVMERF